VKGNFIPIYFEEASADNRFIELIMKCGNRFTARGMFDEAVYLAHKYYLDKNNPRQLIPKEAFINAGLALLLEVNLAKEKEGGIYIRGIKDIGEKRIQEHEMFIEKCSKAGKRSAKIRKEKYGDSIPFNASNKTEQEPNQNRTACSAETEPNRSKLSKVKKESINILSVCPPIDAVSQRDGVGATSKLLAFFCKNYEHYRKIKYIPKYAKDKKLFKSLLSKHIDAYIAFYIKKYFESDDSFIAKTDYSVGVFYTQFNKLEGEFEYVEAWNG
jgi:hypothetical protein